MNGIIGSHVGYHVYFCFVLPLKTKNENWRKMLGFARVFCGAENLVPEEPKTPRFHSNFLGVLTLQNYQPHNLYLLINPFPLTEVAHVRTYAWDPSSRLPEIFSGLFKNSVNLIVFDITSLIFVMSLGMLITKLSEASESFLHCNLLSFLLERIIRSS